MESFKEHPNVRVDKVRQLITVNVDDKVIIRQKNFRGKGRVSSQQTKQHKNYLGQLEIEGLPVSATYIIGGYLLDRTGTNNLGVYFACYNGTQLERFAKLG